MREPRRLLLVIGAAAGLVSCGLRGTPPVPRPPAAVSTLRVEGRDGGVRISWKAGAIDGVKAFDVLRLVDEPGVETRYTKLGTVPVRGADRRYSFVDRSPAVGKTHRYRVRPVTGNASAVSALRYAGPEDEMTWAAPPPAPTGVKGTALHLAARVTWDPVPEAEGYRVYVVATDGTAAAEPSHRGPLDRTEWMAIGLENGVPRRFVVRSVRGFAPRAAVTPRPADPALAGDDGAQAPSAAEVSDAAAQGIGIPAQRLPGELQRAGRELLGEGPLPGIESASSEVVTVTPGATEPPNAPKLLRAATSAEGVSLSWRPSTTEQVVGYVVDRRTVGKDGKPAGDWVRITPEPDPRTSYLDRTVKKGIWYEYRVRAVDGAGTEGALSTPSRPEQHKP